MSRSNNTIVYSLRGIRLQAYGDQTPRLSVVRVKKEKKDKVLKSRPEGVQGLIYDAMKFVYYSQQGLEQVKSIFARIQNLMKKSLDATKSDEDRQLINRQLISAVKRYEEQMKEITVLGESVFRGELIEAPKKMQLSEDPNQKKEMAIELDDFSIAGLKIEKLSVDNMVNARKAERNIERVLKIFESNFEYLRNKDAYLDVERVAKKMIMPAFDQEGGEEDGDQDEWEEENIESRSIQMIDLRRKQENASKAKGRKSGLLLNRSG